MAHVLHLALPQFQAFLIVIVRVGGMLAAWPILGSRAVPLQIKTALVVMLGLVLVPIVRVPEPPSETALLTAGMGAEFVIGMVIGLAVRVLFAGIELAGELIGTQMGLSVVQLFDPTTAQQVPLVGQFHTVIASLVFLSVNAHLIVVRAIAESFEMIPPFGARISTMLMEDVLHLSTGLFVVAVKLAAPILAVALMVNLAMAIIGRSVPHMNVFVLTFPLTIAAGLIVLGTSLPYAVGLMQTEYEHLAGTVHDLLRMLGYG